MARTDLHVWNFGQLANILATEGVKIDEPELSAVTNFAGIKVIADSRLPKGRCEFRDAEGKLLLAFDIAS